jgi:cobalt/nickel transport system permease protein
MFSPMLAMHIPDGFLSIPIALVGWIALIVMIVLALRQTRQQLNDQQIPFLGVLAAFVFAAQMINFPVAGGTSGHLLGGALIAILIGPWASVLVMTSVLAVQALLFQDGGLLAIGFNAFNMGVIAAFVGYAAYVMVRRLLGNARLSQLIGAAVAAWLSVVVAAAATALELALSETAALDVVLPAMLGIHALIGIGEALITVAALAFLQQVRPDLTQNAERQAAGGSGWIAIGLLIALAVTFAAPLADPNPDGLERVAEDQGFIATAQAAPYTILPDYKVPFVEDQALSTILAGVFGVLVVAGVSYGVSRLARKRHIDSSKSS